MAQRQLPHQDGADIKGQAVTDVPVPVTMTTFVIKSVRMLYTDCIVSLKKGGRSAAVIMTSDPRPFWEQPGQSTHLQANTQPASTSLRWSKVLTCLTPN